MKASSLLWPMGLLVSALVVSPTLGAAEPRAAHGGYHGWEERLQQRLGLTDQQVQAIREIRARDAESRKQHYQAMRTARAELSRLILIEADQASIDAKQAEVQQLVAAGVERRVKMLQEVTPLLTPEQREALAQLAEKGKRYRHRQLQRS